MLARAAGGRPALVAARARIALERMPGQTGFSGDGGPATQAGFFLPNMVTADQAGDLLITDTFD